MAYLILLGQGLLRNIHQGTQHVIVRELHQRMRVKFQVPWLNLITNFRAEILHPHQHHQ